MRGVDWAQLAVKRVAGKVADRRIYRVSCLTPGLRFGVHNNNLVNLLRGIRERVFAVEQGGTLVPPPRPNPGFIEQELARFRSMLRRHVVVTTPWDAEKFVSTYEGRRATVYKDAAESLRQQPVHPGDASSSSFLKAEKIPFYAKGDPAPRLIHPRSPRYNVEVGVFIKKIEHEVYQAVDSVWGNKTILKGYNARQVGGILHGKWKRFRNPVGIGLDASRFDQHVSADALAWEHSCYTMWFRGVDAEVLARLLRWQLATKCRARCKDGTVKYKVNGMRFSGDMNTGLGNCLLMCAMVWTWCQKQGIRAELANNGDDCVLILERQDVRRLSLDAMCEWFVAMGFTMKVEKPVHVLEQVEFCQSHPVWTGAEWLMVRRHRHAMAKDCISIKPLDSKPVFDKWRRSVGLAGLSLTGGIPVQQEFYLALMRGAGQAVLTNEPTMETGFMRFARGMDRVASEVHPEARLSYWLAFGVTPDEQEALEHVYRGVNPTWAPPVTMNTVPTVFALNI